MSTGAQPRVPHGDDPDAGELLAVAIECAERAAGVLLGHFGRPLADVRAKSGPTDLVSAADVAAEDAVRAVLARCRPDDGILAEEGAPTPSRSGLRWVVDPLDGTANFVQRIPHWAVSVACEDADGSVVAVIHDPLRDERFTAVRGRGAHCGGRRLRASTRADLRLATVGGDFSARTPAQADAARRLVSHAGNVRAYGSAALDLAWAAAGRFDAVYHSRYPEPWDVAAGSLICAEAGLGVMRVVDERDGSARLIAAAPSLRGELRAVTLG